MATKFMTLFCLAAAASAVHVPVSKVYAQPAAYALPVAKYAEPEHYAPAQYEYAYSVHDTHSGDVKEQKESRQGDAVQGYYSLLQPDGTTRTVHYTADKEHGFNAQVTYEGHPQPQPAKLAYAAPVAKLVLAPAQPHYAPAPAHYAPAPAHYAPAPVAKLAYTAPVAKLAYTAPVAKHAYTAPVAKLAYTAPVAKVAYAPAPVQYHAAPAHPHHAAPAYTENLGHVSFSSPAASYHH